MASIQLNESGLAHVGIKTDVLLSMAERIIRDQAPKTLQAGQILSLNLTWVDDKSMRRLNRQYRGEDQTTDVLSFSYVEDASVEPGPERTIGDLIISLPTLKKQAKERGKTLQEEALVLFVHGLLHILGYDHELGPRALEKMLAQEQKYLGDNAGLIERAEHESKMGSD